MKLPRAPGDKRTIVYDLETYKNWYCIAATDGERTMCAGSDDIDRLQAIVRGLVSKNIVLAGFNNQSYDDIILRTIIENPQITPQQVNRLSARIIDPQDGQEEDANFAAKYSKTPWAYSIDVFQLLNGKGSLKEHACRSHVQDVGETPYEFGKDLPAEGFKAVEEYCKMDVRNTCKKLASLWQLVELRAKLGDMFDLGDRPMCLTEQGIAQATFLKLHRDRSGQYAAEIRKAAQEHPDNLQPVWAADAIISPRVRFGTKPFQEMLEKLKEGKLKRLDATGAKWELLAPRLPTNLVVSLAGCRFQLGVGGLHSIDQPGIFHSALLKKIIDLDVTSYYPSIIINERLYPGHIGPGFADDMRRLRDLRVTAKKAGDKVVADALKIVVNATFGKLNDVWSPLRSVPNAMRVTINGQLFLLMLIERLHEAGFQILSSNTDGVTLTMPRSEQAEGALTIVTKMWEYDTKFDLERADYVIYARRDVNSYVAMTADDKPKVKLKGAFQPDTGKGDGLIIKKAAVDYLTKGVPILDTIYNAKPEELIFYQRCKNGGKLMHGEKPIGKLARWYASTDGGAIRRVNPNGTMATLPHAHNATLVMNMDDFGMDIDFTHYAREAQALVDSCSL